MITCSSFLQIKNHFGKIGRRPFTKHFAQRHEVAAFDHAPDFGFQNFADHNCCSRAAAAEF
jgi:hypothetical protein